MNFQCLDPDPLNPQDFGSLDLDPDPQKYEDPRIRLCGSTDPVMRIHGSGYADPRIRIGGVKYQYQKLQKKLF